VSGQNGRSFPNAMEAAAKSTLHLKRNGGRFQMEAPLQKRIRP